MACEYSDLVIIPESLTFERKEGSRFVSSRQNLFIGQVRTTSTSVLPPGWDALSDEEWIRLSPVSGRGKGTIRVSVDSRGLRAGEYNGQVAIGSPVTDVTVTPTAIPVKLIVKGKETTPTPEPEPTSQPDEPEPTPSETVEPTPEPIPPEPVFPKPDSPLLKLLKLILELFRRWR
jgi:hypothetical protein